MAMEAGEDAMNAKAILHLGRCTKGLFISRRRMCALILGIMAAFALGTALRRPALARPDPPVISGNTATFMGDQHLGIANPTDFVTPPIYTIKVNNLTTDITPEAYTSGIWMTYMGAHGIDGSGGWWSGNDGGPGDPGLNLTVNYDGGNHSITTQGNNAYGIVTSSTGGNGGPGGGGGAVISGKGGDGGQGGAGGEVTITSNGTITTSGPNAYGLLAASLGGNGGNGGTGGGAFAGLGGAGGDGGASEAVTVASSGVIATAGDYAAGIVARSEGGLGGHGGNAGGSLDGDGGWGGYGGASGAVTVNSSSNITTQGHVAAGISAASLGGHGGNGGDGWGTCGAGDIGYSGGAGGAVMITSNGAITTQSQDSYGIFAQSVGGTGGKGGNAGGLSGDGGDAGAGSAGGAVTVTNNGAITTAGSQATAIFAQSLGGPGGKGGNGGGVFTCGGDGGAGAASGVVTVTNKGAIATTGSQASGIVAQSLGGAGGDGGTAGGVYAPGGATKGSGPGGQVTINSSGAITTQSQESYGIFAQSVGGFAGSAGVGGGIIAFGGSGNSAGDGGQVSVTVQDTGVITTTGDDSFAIFAQSVGGGGGNGGASGGMIALGGAGSAGGHGNTVTINNSAPLRS
jgi:hypothetical protein